MNALIFTTNNNQIVQVEVTSFPTAPDLVWVDCPDNCTTEWTYDGTNFSPPAPIPQPTADENKATAKSLLFATDWTTIADVTNPEISNPYLVNQDEFITYRNTIRNIAVYPIGGNIDWAIAPPALWQQV